MFPLDTLRRATLAAALLLSLFCGADGRAESSDARSREHHRLGSEYYDRGQFLEALHEFQAGRAVSNRPAFLYNIGRCYERLGDWQAAADAYDAYLPAAEPSERSELIRLIASLRARAAPGLQRLAESRPSPFYRRAWFWGTAAAVVVSSVAIGLGVGLGAQTPTVPTLGSVTFHP
jgi:tetratricopeptide (TPR) repeat protein